jgi:dTDP-glucose 4,6-dehydratase
MNLASHLTARADEVVGISRSEMRGEPFTYGLEYSHNFKYYQAHLVTQLPQVMTILDVFRPDVIVNFAALCEVGLSWTHPLDYYETNLMSLVRLTNELANRTYFKRFVQIGSSEVYGSVTRPVDESGAVCPSSPYAASKAAFDFHLRCISRTSGFPGIIAMPSNGYCEGQTLNRIIPKAIICAKTGQRLKLQGGGLAKKSYLHGDDISKAIMLVMDKGKLGETYHCGPLIPVSIRYIVEKVARMMDVQFTDLVEIAPERTGQDSQYWLNSSKIEELGWRQEILFDEGLERMKQWVERFPELLTMDQTYRHRP